VFPALSVEVASAVIPKPKTLYLPPLVFSSLALPSVHLMPEGINLERAIGNLPCLLAARCGGDSLSHKGDWQAREKRRAGKKEKENIRHGYSFIRRGWLLTRTIQL
jgi:hypothetical protein